MPYTTEAAINALVTDGRVLVPLVQLPDVFARDNAITVGMIGELHTAGLLTVWADAPDGPAVALTSLAAERMGVRASPAGRWVSVDAKDPPARKQPVRHGPYATSESDLPPRPNGNPRSLDEEAAPPAVPAHDAMLWGAAWDLVDGRPKGKKLPSRNFVPTPTLFLGMNWQWPVVRIEGEPCPVCGVRRLRLVEVCLCCDRGGVDRLLSRERVAAKPRHAYRPDPDLEGGTQRKAI